MSRTSCSLKSSKSSRFPISSPEPFFAPTRAENLAVEIRKALRVKQDPVEQVIIREVPGHHDRRAKGLDV